MSVHTQSQQEWVSRPVDNEDSNIFLVPNSF